jgi:hypothetical protein
MHRVCAGRGWPQQAKPVKVHDARSAEAPAGFIGILRRLIEVRVNERVIA